MNQPDFAAAVKLARDYIAACGDFYRTPLRYLAVHLQDDGVTCMAVQRPQPTLAAAAHAVRGMRRLEDGAEMLVIDLDTDQPVAALEVEAAVNGLCPVMTTWSVSERDFGNSVVVGNDLVTFPCTVNGGMTRSRGFIEPLPNAREQLSQFFSVYSVGQQRVGFDHPEVVTKAVRRHIDHNLVGDLLPA